MKFTDLAEQRTSLLEDLSKQLGAEITFAYQTMVQADNMRYREKKGYSPYFYVAPEGNDSPQKMQASEAAAKAFTTKWSLVEDALKALKQGKPTREHYLTLVEFATSTENTAFHQSIKSLMADVEPFNPAPPEPVEVDFSRFEELYAQHGINLFIC